MNGIATGDVAFGGADGAVNGAHFVGGCVDALLLRGCAGGEQGKGREDDEVFHNRGSDWNVRPWLSVGDLARDVK